MLLHKITRYLLIRFSGPFNVNAKPVSLGGKIQKVQAQILLPPFHQAAASFKRWKSVWFMSHRDWQRSAPGGLKRQPWSRPHGPLRLHRVTRQAPNKPQTSHPSDENTNHEKTWKSKSLPTIQSIWDELQETPHEKSNGKEETRPDLVHFLPKLSLSKNDDLDLNWNLELCLGN